MFIILCQDTWSQYEIVPNHLGRPKIFKTKNEAFEYCTEFKIFPFQIIDILI